MMCVATALRCRHRRRRAPCLARPIALKIAVGQCGNWRFARRSRLATVRRYLGQPASPIEAVCTAGVTGETPQAVISGQLPTSVGIGTLGALGALRQGRADPHHPGAARPATPTSGSSKADRRSRRSKDATDATTIAYSSYGASTHAWCSASCSQLGAEGQAGGDRRAAAATLTVARRADRRRAGPRRRSCFDMPTTASIRICRRGAPTTVPSLKGQTIRVETSPIANSRGQLRRGSCASHGARPDVPTARQVSSDTRRRT